MRYPCLSVRLDVSKMSSPNFIKLPVAVVWSSSDDSAITLCSYILVDDVNVMFFSHKGAYRDTVVTRWRVIHHDLQVGARDKVCYRRLPRFVFIGSRPSDHYFRSVCLSVALFVCLFACAEFFQPFLIRFRSN